MLLALELHKVILIELEDNNHNNQHWFVMFVV